MLTLAAQGRYAQPARELRAAGVVVLEAEAGRVDEDEHHEEHLELLAFHQHLRLLPQRRLGPATGRATRNAAALRIRKGGPIARHSIQS